MGSFAIGVAVSNLTINQFSNDSQFVTDQRGYNSFVKGEASELLEENDLRLLLNTVVTGITYSDNGVTVEMANGDCIKADYAICKF